LLRDTLTERKHKLCTYTADIYSKRSCAKKRTSAMMLRAATHCSSMQLQQSACA